MSYVDGWAAIHGEMPARVPRVEFDADQHWELVSRVTGLPVGIESDHLLKLQARQAFVRAWDYDLMPSSPVSLDELAACRTYMGHSEYAAGGVDLDRNVGCPFSSPEEVLAFDPWEAYGPRDQAALTSHLNALYHDQCAAFPDAVNTSGIYVTLVSGLIIAFGWDLLLTAGGLDPAGLGAVAQRYTSWILQHYQALAASDAHVVWCHDDIVWASGPIFRPSWYREFIFPNLARLFEPLREAKKRIIFVSDGDYTMFVDDLAQIGVHGFFFEPLTDLAYVVERYGQTHIIIGNVDTRVLLTGSRDAIRREVERCMTLGKSCPGYFCSVSNMIPANTPIESALYYNEVYEELSRR